MHVRLTTLGHYLLIGLAIAALGGVLARGLTIAEIALYCLLVGIALLLALLLSVGHDGRPR